MITLGKRSSDFSSSLLTDKDGSGGGEFIRVTRRIHRDIPPLRRILSHACTPIGEKGPRTFPPLTSRILSPSKTRRVVINARGYTKLGIESLDFEILFYRAEIITRLAILQSRGRERRPKEKSFLSSGARLVNVRTKQLYLFEEEERRFVLSTQPR